jgi:hypothetical protein
MLDVPVAEVAAAKATWAVVRVADAARVYAKTLPKCRVEIAMNSMLAHLKYAVCHKGC